MNTGPKGSGTPHSWTHADVEQSIPQRFAAIVSHFPDRIAIKTAAGVWTYAELNWHARNIARSIFRAGGSELQPVALFFDQGLEVNAATLGALMARKIYVPLNPHHPPAVLAQVLNDAEIGLILTDTGHYDRARELGESTGIPVIDVASRDLASATVNFEFQSVAPNDPAYIYYTSGSTGKPKGVVDSHRNVLHNILRYSRQLHIQADDRLSLLQAPAFSGAVSSLFSALLNGATSFPVDLRTTNPDALAEWLIQERVTMIHCVPALFRALMREGRMFPDVRVVRLEGDQASLRDLELFRTHFSPECILANGLGATEMGLARQWIVSGTAPVDGFSTLPVGHPVPDVRILILDENGNDAAIQAVGEIAAESEYLALGYWKNPEATDRQFISRNGKRIYKTGDMGRLGPDGCLEYLGRKDDSLVKVRGQFVAPAEIENQLRAVEMVKDAAVIARPDRRGENELVAFVVTSEPMSALRAELDARLPQGMLPAKFIRLEKLPLNENGKVDRRALQTLNPEPDRTDRDQVAPRTETESRLVKIWANVLGVENVSVEARFFDIGGDSLRAFQILSRLRDEFQVDLNPIELFDAPTIAAQAELLESRRRK